MPTGIAKSGKRNCKPRVERVELHCETCGQAMYFLPSQLRVRKRIRYCSNTCKGEARRKPGTRVQVQCSNCCKLFEKRSDHLTPNNYCSRQCRDLARQVPGAKWRDPEQIKAYMREYTRANREKHNARNRRWIAQNKSKRFEVQARYRQTHADAITVLHQRRRHQVVRGDLTVAQWSAIKEAANNCCVYCGRGEPEIRLTLDHIIPLSKGGEHTAKNVQPLCQSCNSRKGVSTTVYRLKKRWAETEHGITIKEIRG